MSDVSPLSAASKIIAASIPNRARLPERLHVANQDRGVHERHEMRAPAARPCHLVGEGQWQVWRPGWSPAYRYDLSG